MHTWLWLQTLEQCTRENREQPALVYSAWKVMAEGTIQDMGCSHDILNFTMYIYASIAIASYPSYLASSQMPVSQLGIIDSACMTAVYVMSK